MKLRISQWLDTRNPDGKESPIKYGIQARTDAGWVNCHENGEPLFFDTPKAALEHVHQIETAHQAIGMASPRLVE